MVSDRGNGGYWRVCLALIGVGFLLLLSLGIGAYFGALNASYYSYQAKKSAYHHSDTEKPNPSQIYRDRVGLPYFAERITTAPDPKDGNEREKRDLAAQEAMSVWAFWMLVASVVGVATTMTGTGFLLWQIILTREAVRDTGAATKAMEAQTKLMADAQRPWVVVEKAQWVGDVIQIHLKNIGTMPARDFCKAVEASAMPKVFLVSPVPEIDDLNSTTLYPGQAEILSLDAPNDLKNGYEWFVRIRATYKLPSAKSEHFYEGLAFDNTKRCRKVTPRDFVGPDKTHNSQNDRERNGAGE